MSLKILLIGWAAAIVVGIAICIVFGFHDVIPNAEMANDVDYSEEIQEAIDRVDREIFNIDDSTKTGWW